MRRPTKTSDVLDIPRGPIQHHQTISEQSLLSNHFSSTVTNISLIMVFIFFGPGYETLGKLSLSDSWIWNVSQDPEIDESYHVDTSSIRELLDHHVDI